MGNVKLIIEVPEWYYEETKEFKHPTLIDKALINGIPLDSAEGEYIKKEDALDKIVEQLPQRAFMRCQKAIESLPTYSFPEREKETDGTLVYNANGHFYGVMGGDAIMERMRGKADEKPREYCGDDEHCRTCKYRFYTPKNDIVCLNCHGGERYQPDEKCADISGKENNNETDK